MEEKRKESPGPGCRNLNIFSSTLKDSLSNIDDLQSLHRPLVVASNELVLELLSFKNYCTLSFSDMLKWVGAISFLDAMSLPSMWVRLPPESELSKRVEQGC